MTGLPKTAEEALDILINTEMHPLDDLDYECFEGIESDNPLIGKNEDSDLTVIVDNSIVELLDIDDDGNAHYENFKLVKL